MTAGEGNYKDRICPQGAVPAPHVEQQMPRWPGEQSAGAERAPREWQPGTLSQGAEGLQMDAEEEGERFAMDRVVVGFDIDGVLSDSRWRLALLNDKSSTVGIEDRERQVTTIDKTLWLEFDGPHDDRRWREFYDQGKWDRPFPEGQDLLQQLREVFDIVYITGRTESNRGITIDWLSENDMLPLGVSERHGLDKAGQQSMWEASHDWLFMRPEGMHAPAHELKAEHVTELEDGGRKPFVFLDDDYRVVSKLVSMGVAAVLVTWHREGIRGASG